MFDEYAVVSPCLLFFPESYLRLQRNTQIIDTCIVFRSWHITSTTSFVFSFFAIVAIGIFYEWLRSYQKLVDKKILAADSKGKVRLSVSRDGSRERIEEDGGFLGRRKTLGYVVPWPNSYSI